jgi:pyruvate ferredoxin oxidoreductase alpha subunit
MLKQIEGSRAIAEAVAACRPQVVPAYPISPQTHIVEALAELVATGELNPCRFVTVESEFAAMSLAIGASATGSRAYTATASQGLLYMVEALYNASGLGLPIVMTVANRAIGAPINIWNDHSDSMSQRDSGWIQLYATDNQHAADLHVLAFRLAEQLSVPVMVCVDGFVLTHAVERVDVPEQSQVDSYLPPYVPRQVLNPAEPYSIGAMVGPEAFTEVKYLAHQRIAAGLNEIPVLAADLEGVLRRPVPGLLSPYRVEGADTVVVTLGSTFGTLCDVVDAERAGGHAVGALGLVSFRPFPIDALRGALAGAPRVIVLERAFSCGAGGIVTADLRPAVASGVNVRTAIAGLGGRPVTSTALHRLIDDGRADRLPELSFVDLDQGLVEHEMARLTGDRASGPTAESLLRQVRERVSAGSHR